MKTQRKHRIEIDAVQLAGLAGSFTEELLAELAPHADVLHVSAGTVLAQAGRVPHQFIAVVEGHVEVTGADGCVRLAGPGTRIGADELVGERPHTSTITTTSPATLVVIFGPAYRGAARAMAGETAAGTEPIAPLVRRTGARAALPALATANR